MVQIIESVGETLKCDIQVNAAEKYFHQMLFILLYKGTLTFESVRAPISADRSIK